MGKTKDPSEAAQEHQSVPLSTLRDPASFGPPPKRILSPAPSAYTSPDQAPPSLGAPLSREEAGAKQRLQAQEEARRREEEEAAKPVSRPYTVDSTGLSTTHLPLPPVRRLDQEAQQTRNSPPPTTKPKLPPRLPPRQNSRPNSFTGDPPPTYSESTGYLNEGALSRLGQAGVSVPGLDIGRTTSPPVPPPRHAVPPPPLSPPSSSSHGAQLSELQSRFSTLSASRSNSQDVGRGTTLGEKRGALKTANDLRTNPSKVSFSEMKSAAATANSMYERHGSKVGPGLRAAGEMGQQYGVANRVNSYSSGGPVPPPLPSPGAGGLVGKKRPPPPPPPPKKRELGTGRLGEPPPVPLASKPKS
jgi:hypothetical protein